MASNKHHLFSIYPKHKALELTRNLAPLSKMQKQHLIWNHPHRANLLALQQLEFYDNLLE